MNPIVSVFTKIHCSDGEHLKARIVDQTEKQSEESRFPLINATLRQLNILENWKLKRSIQHFQNTFNSFRSQNAKLI